MSSSCKGSDDTVFRGIGGTVTMVLNRKLFGPKMAELWAKNACPYMGAQTIFDYNSALN